MKTIPLVEQLLTSNAMYQRALLTLPDFTSNGYPSMREVSRAIDGMHRRGETETPSASQWALVDPYVISRWSWPAEGVPLVPRLDQQILSATERGSLGMSNWHCGATHCRAGWAVVLAGNKGRFLEACYGTENAARLIYEASTGRIAPDFYATQEDAIADIRRCAELTKGLT